MFEPPSNDELAAMDKDIIAVDLDGTIIEYSGDRTWNPNEFGDIKPGAVNWLHDARELGKIIIIYTARDNQQLVEDFLLMNKIPFDYVKSGKLYYHRLIDDRGERFESWDKVIL